MNHITMTDLAVDETLDDLALSQVLGGFSWRRFGIGVGIAAGGLALVATGGLGLGIAFPLLAILGSGLAYPAAAVSIGAAAGGLGLFGWGGFKAARAFGG